MVFSSIFFIFCFLPPFLLLYYLVPEKFRNILLFIGSLIFYAWGDPIYVVLMLFSSFFNYYMALEIDHLDKDPKGRKKNLIFAVTINLLILGFFKYWGFLLDTFSTITGISIAHPQLALPIGISFYTFKNLSYILDVSKKKVSPQRKFLTYAVYSTMFPHMSAGPIVRYADIEGQLTRRSISLTRLGLGAEYFTKGLAKKVLLADNLSAIYTSILSSGSNSVLTAWIGILAYTLQLYFDFSGYSDMAIGLGKMMGFDFQRFRILAKMAHLSWKLVPGLYLYPSWGQPCFSSKTYPQHFCCMGTDRFMARCKLEFYFLGIILWTAPST